MTAQPTTGATVPTRFDYRVRVMAAQLQTEDAKAFVQLWSELTHSIATKRDPWTSAR